ncbi:hypothetical protein ACVWWP_008298 [Bradyrhizobium sp. LM3.6]
MAHREHLDARLYRRSVIAQHVKARAKGDDLDRHRLTELAVVLRDVGCIVEYQVHHRGFVGIHLQDQPMRLVGDLGSCCLSQPRLTRGGPVNCLILRRLSRLPVSARVLLIARYALTRLRDHMVVRLGLDVWPDQEHHRQAADDCDCRLQTDHLVSPRSMTITLLVWRRYVAICTQPPFFHARS